MLTLANSTNQPLDLRTLGEPKPAWPSEAKSPNEWFSAMFPAQAKVFGSPFLEDQQANQYGDKAVTPVVPNIDFLAACLGGDHRLGHRVVYYANECQFYYLDPHNNMYYATTAEKLGNLLRGLLARCAAEVKGEAHLLNLFNTFRNDTVVKAVVNRCKSVLEAAPDFFGVNSSNQRIAGPEIHERLARVFVEQMLEPHEGSCLTMSRTFTLFNQFAKRRNMTVLNRQQFKPIMGEVIREKYNLGLRNDIISAETDKQQCGWKGLRPVSVTVAA